MARANTPEEKQIIKLVEKMPIKDTVRMKWLKRLHEDGMTTELAEEMRKKLTTAPREETEAEHTMRMSAATSLNAQVQRWRLAEQRKAFSKH